MSSPAQPPAAQGAATPRFLRLARAAAAAAALLTGVAATGTFSTGGINATPNVIASQWAAAEQAGVQIAQADLQAVTRLAATEPDEGAGAPAGEALADYDALLAQTSRDLSRMGDSSGEAAADWTGFVAGVERAGAGAGLEDDSAGQVYAEASAAARAAAAQTDQVAGQHADDLLTGSRSMLTAIIGTAGTLVLGAILVRLALLTRRILNVPLLIATVITGGLSYLSINPAALPLDYDERVRQTSNTADALQSVLQARTAQQAEALGLGQTWDSDAASATEAIEALGDEDLVTAWVLVADVGAEPSEIEASQDDFDQVEADLVAMFSDRVDRVSGEVSAPAVLTTGAALALGLIGAWLAWAGVSQRLRDYR